MSIRHIAQSKLFYLFALLLPTTAFAASGSQAAITFLWIAVILLLAKASTLVEKIGLPPVMGELVLGIVLGNFLFISGIDVFEAIKHDEIIKFLAELGVVILMLQVGLESSFNEMRHDAKRSFMVAIIGVVVPFALGVWVTPLLLPGLELNAYLFIGATLTATSVGITARIFKDANIHRSSAGRIVLGAAVIDDIIGLLILAALIGVVTTGAIGTSEILLIIAKAIAFLFIAIALGGHIKLPGKGETVTKINRLMDEYNVATLIARFSASINDSDGMKFTFVIAMGLIFAFVANQIGLAPIIGAFAAGLILEHLHFKPFQKPEVVHQVQRLNNRFQPSGQDHVEHRQKVDQLLEKHTVQHVDDLINPLAHLLVPIFFVVVGMQVDLATMQNPTVILSALAITVIAIIGKWVSGLAAPKGSRNLVGFGMSPRGEVGLIFALIGKQVGVISGEVFSIIILVVVFTTLFTPPVLSYLIKKMAK